MIKISDNKLTTHVDPWKPKDNQKEDNYKRFTSLRVQHPNLKVEIIVTIYIFTNLSPFLYMLAIVLIIIQVSLAIKYSAAEYARNAATHERRQRFIKRATEFTAGHKFNGLDLIWDFSDQRYILIRLSKFEVKAK